MVTGGCCELSHTRTDVLARTMRQTPVPWRSQNEIPKHSHQGVVSLRVFYKDLLVGTWKSGSTRRVQALSNDHAENLMVIRKLLLTVRLDGDVQ